MGDTTDSDYRYAHGIKSAPCVNAANVPVPALLVDTFTTARGRLMLMLRLMLPFFTPDTDIPLTDTPVLDTTVLDTPDSDTLLPLLSQLLLLLLLLLPLLLPLLPLPLSTMPFLEPRICPTPCTLWLTLTWEPCTPAMWECALTTWESRCPARQTLVFIVCVREKQFWKFCGNV